MIFVEDGDFEDDNGKLKVAILRAATSNMKNVTIVDLSESSNLFVNPKNERYTNICDDGAIKKIVQIYVKKGFKNFLAEEKMEDKTSNLADTLWGCPSDEETSTEDMTSNGSVTIDRIFLKQLLKKTKKN